MRETRTTAPRVVVWSRDVVGRAALGAPLVADGYVVNAPTGLPDAVRAVGGAPDLLIVDLGEPDGFELLRRVDEVCRGPRPAIIVVGEPETLADERLGDVAVDAGVLVPCLPHTVVGAARLVRALGSSALASRDVQEVVVRATLFQPADLEQAVSEVAQKLAEVLGASECVLTVHIGERQVTGALRGPDASGVWDDVLVSRSQTALELGAPVLAPFGETSAAAYLTCPLEPDVGAPVGFILIAYEGNPTAVPPGTVQLLRTLGRRLAVEAAWRSVHERIVADRERLRERSMTDPLCGVWTRAALEHALPQEVAASIRRREPLTVGVLDLRQLRRLNERHGHAAGDAALRHVSGIVRGALRAQDLIARWTGDTLAVVLPGTAADDAERVVRRIQEMVAGAPIVFAGTSLPLALVGGMAGLLGADDTGEAAMARAGRALKSAKRKREPLVVADRTSPEEAATPEAEVALEPGTTLGGVYEVLHEISSGAMGVVYRAEDLGLGRPVAVKMLRPDLARDEGFVARFRAEASTLASLRHENLVQVYAFGAEGEAVYFVMELVEGEALEHRMDAARERAESLPTGEIATILGQIGSALDVMHSAGIVHRDVKPANILLERGSSRAVLVDVGIARRADATSYAAGTPGFTAPESFTGGQEGPATDVYGLAATAYALVCRRDPFEAPRLNDVIARQLAGRPTPPSRLRPDLPPELDGVLLGALDPDPTRRPSSASAFARELATALGSNPFAAAPVTLTEAPRRPTVRRSELQFGATAFLGARRAVETTPPPTTGPVRSRASMEGTVLSGAGPRETMRQPRAAVTRGVWFRSSYRVLGAQQAATWAKNVARRYPELGRALQPEIGVTSWHSSDLFVQMLRAIAESGRDARAFARELGRAAAATTFARFFGAKLESITPDQVFRGFDVLWRRYQGWGTVTSEVTPHSATIHVTEALGEPLVCPTISGLLEQITQLTGGREVSVMHVDCQAGSHGDCQFDVMWKTD